jgi:hypothetical protein
LSQEAAQGSARYNHIVAQSTEDARRKECETLQGMWTGHGERLRDSSQHAEEAEREHSSTKASNEYEKAQPVSQENASDIKTVDETSSMINEIHFCLLGRGMDFVSLHPISYWEVGILTDIRTENIQHAEIESHILQRTGVHWTCDSLRKI